VLLRLAYLTVTNAFAALRLLPMGDRDKDVEILALRHQIAVLERQLGADTRVSFAPEDRAFLAAPDLAAPRDPAPTAASHPAGYRPAPAPRVGEEASCSTTGTEPIKPWLKPPRCVLSRTRSRIRRESPTRMYADETGLAASFTSTHMLLDLHGWNFRQAQSRRTRAGRVGRG
jgi:hypothetical protein